MIENLHKLLKRQLEREGIQNMDSLPSLIAWERLVARINKAYFESDKYTYLLERAAMISHKEMEGLYQELAQRRDKLQAIMSDGLCFLDENYCIDSLNAKAELILGTTYEEAGEKKLFKLLDIYTDPAKEYSLQEDELAKQLLLGKPFFMEEVHIKNMQGRLFPATVVFNPMLKENTLVGAAMVFRDISEHKKVEKLASFDVLTRLPNRYLFQELLKKSVAKARRYDRNLALLYVDLDLFKNINDNYSHEQGDAVLQEVGTRLTRCVRESDYVARIGGDEFAVILDDADDRAATLVAKKIIQSINYPYYLRDYEMSLGCSVGVACYPAAGKTPETLLKNADIAMYRAKNAGRNNHQLFTKKINKEYSRRLKLESDLKLAIENDELKLHYQPIYDATSVKITGLEALLHWRHPTLGLVTPNQFIPIAEDTGLIIPVGDWVTKTAMRQYVEICRGSGTTLHLSINLSTKQLGQIGFLEDFRELLKRFPFAPELIQFEITETGVMSDVRVIENTMASLHELGVKFAIDDFGTGYSSLSRLKNLPIDCIKIDQSFLKDVTTNKSSAMIVKGCVALAKNLGIKVIAEGVENEAQLNFIKEAGCDEVQGFYFSKPLSSKEIIEYIKKPLVR